jgi:tRNA 2-thiouridine synthesizing protein A
MSKTVDARGLSCPQPVLITLEEIQAAKETDLLIIVDNEASRENVMRAVRTQGWTVRGFEEDGNDYKIHAAKGA